jgi:WD40 repeat protein
VHRCGGSKAKSGMGWCLWFVKAEVIVQSSKCDNFFCQYFAESLAFSPLGYIPSSLMIPPRRFVTLLDQARLHQISQCIYHNAPLTSQHFSLYADHTCDTDLFPRITTTILQVHNDEVWSLEWSHSGKFLASASKDKSVIIWSVGVCVILLLNTVGSYAMF